MSASHGPMAERVLDEYLAAIRRGERRAAFAVIDAAQRDGLPLGDIYMDVFQPALREIGRLWQENEISVADEHLATAITQSAMAQLYGRALTATAAGAHVVVAACADNERHEVGLRMICDLLECDGWDAHYLGAAVPVESLVRMVADRQPDVVALSTALTSHLPRLRAMIEAVRAASASSPTPPLIVVGGRPFVEDPTLAERLGADLTAHDAVSAVALVRERIEATA